MKASEEAPHGVASRPVTDHTVPRQRIRVLAPLAAILLLWVWLTVAAGAVAQGPGGRAFGEDFDVYLTAAHQLRAGANPYDSRILYQAEQHLLGQAGMHVVEPRALVRVANPPLFFWILGPLTFVPLRDSVVLWDLVVLGAALGGFLGLLAIFGWRRRLLPALFFSPCRRWSRERSMVRLPGSISGPSASP